MEDERGPGLDFTLCFVCGSRPRGAAAFLLCLFILLLKCLNVRRFPPPSSRIYELRYSDFLKSQKIKIPGFVVQGHILLLQKFEVHSKVWDEYDFKCFFKKKFLMLNNAAFI